MLDAWNHRSASRLAENSSRNSTQLVLSAAPHILKIYLSYKALRVAAPYVKDLLTWVRHALVRRAFAITTLDDARRYVAGGSWRGIIVQPTLDYLIEVRNARHEGASRMISQDELLMKLREAFNGYVFEIQPDQAEDGAELGVVLRGGVLFDKYVAHHIPHINTCTPGVGRTKLLKQIGVIPDGDCPEEFKRMLRDLVFEIPHHWFCAEHFRV